MPKSWIETGFAVAVVGVCLVLAALLGLWGYMEATPPLHPSGRDVPSVTRAAPLAAWAAAVERGRQVARTGLAEQNLPGLSVAVGIDGEIVWAEGLGWADLESRLPVVPETQFRIGTASIALTSAAVGLLLEDGRLTLDEAIQHYVPAFPHKPWPVTLRQVMGHLAGIGTDGGDEGPLLARHCERPVDALPHFANHALRFEPGTEFRASSYGWILVSAAVEAAAGEPFLRFMRKRVFEPLGMDDTGVDSVTSSMPDRATPYFPRFAGDPRYGPDLMRPIDHSCYAGASAFLSTPSDLVRFGMAMHGGGLLQPATVRHLQTSQRLDSGAETGYGLGWHLETVSLAGAPTRAAGHDGDVLGGMATSLLAFPEHGLVVAVTSNISYAGTAEVARAIADAFTSRP